MISAVKALERQFATQCGFAGAVGVGFGRAALRLALEAIGVRGSEVLVPDFVCAQVAKAVRRAGGTPVYFPVERNLDVAPDAFCAALSARTRAAVLVHYFGRPLPSIAKIAQICRDKQIPLIEDCALALGCEGIGAYGAAAVFSFTKSDWCYGAGLLASRDAGFIEQARTIRETLFRPAAKLAFEYGLLWHADFSANRPDRSRMPDFAGRSLERFFGMHEHGFYDAGRFDARMADFAARRARRLLSSLGESAKHRREIVAEIRRALGASQSLLIHPADCAQDSGAFLLIDAMGNAHAWRERAAHDGVTLRLSWPAYQNCGPAQDSAVVSWLAENLLLMEVHPNLSSKELQRIVACLNKIAGK